MVVGWSRDGQRVRSGSWDNTIREWDAHNGAHVALFTFPHLFEAKAMPLAWNLDAATFAMGLEDRRVTVADMVEGKLWQCRAVTTPVELLGQADKKQQASMRNSVRQGQQVKIWGGIEKEVVTYHGHADPGAQDCACFPADRKSTRLNSSHQIISYAVFCLKK